MPLGCAYLFLNQIKIIQQPFARRRNPAVGLDCRRQQRAGLQQNVFIFRQAREELIGRALRAQSVRARQGLAVLFHLVGAIQFCPQRRRIADVTLASRAIAAHVRPQTGPGVAYACAAQFHFRQSRKIVRVLCTPAHGTPPCEQESEPEIGLVAAPTA